MKRTKEEFEQNIKEQVISQNQFKEDNYEKFSVEEKENFLKENGWIKSQKNDSFGISFWKKPSWSSYLNLEMSFIHAKKEEEEKKELKQDKFCNNCGKCITKKEEGTFLGDYGLLGKYSTGYFSDPLFDTLTFKFCICEECLLNMFLNFEKMPSVEQYII